jgi:hypothetical protein
MKEIYLIISFLFFGIRAFSQTPLTTAKIDSIVVQNEQRVETVFQKTEINRLKSSHGKNPDYISRVYRFNSKSALLSVTYFLFSVGDTVLIINFYFDSAKLIKIKTIDSEAINKTEDIFYYSNNLLINNETAIKGPYAPDYYVGRAMKIRKNLKRRPIKFPE